MNISKYCKIWYKTIMGSTITVRKSEAIQAIGMYSRHLSLDAMFNKDRRAYQESWYHCLGLESLGRTSESCGYLMALMCGFLIWFTKKLQMSHCRNASPNAYFRSKLEKVSVAAKLREIEYGTTTHPTRSGENRASLESHVSVEIRKLQTLTCLFRLS